MNNLIQKVTTSYILYRNNQFEKANEIYVNANQHLDDFSDNDRIYWQSTAYVNWAKMQQNDVVKKAIVAHRDLLTRKITSGADNENNIMDVVELNILLKQYSRIEQLFNYLQIHNQKILIYCWKEWGFPFIGIPLMETGHYELIHKYCNFRKDFSKELRASMQYKYCEQEHLQYYKKYAEIIQDHLIMKIILSLEKNHRPKAKRKKRKKIMAY